MDIKIVRVICGALLGVVGIVCGAIIVIFGPEGSIFMGYLIAIISAWFGFIITIS